MTSERLLSEELALRYRHILGSDFYNQWMSDGKKEPERAHSEPMSRASEDRLSFDELFEKAANFVFDESKRGADLALIGIVIPERKVGEGVLIKANAVPMLRVMEIIGSDWMRALEFPPDKWEEIIAGAYDEAGFDEVILTPRSGDHGRDVIAIRKGLGSIKVLNSVKAYKPGNLVGYNDVRALLGVLSGERDASKGIVITTSDFPPKISQDPFIAPFMPYRLELVNGVTLQKWIKDLLKTKVGLGSDD